MLFLIVKRRLLIGRRLFCSQGWRRKQCLGARRQQGRRPPGNGFGAACWRGRMKGKGFEGSKAPTTTLADREKPARVGVGGRRNKASRGARRQQGRRQPGKNLGPVGVGGRRNKASRGARHQHRRRQLGKNRTLLALADGETKLPEGRGANIGAVSLGKSGPCWRWRTEKQSYPRSEAPTCPALWGL